MEECCKEEKKELTINSWEVEEAMRTLTRAEELKQDEKLMELVAKKAQIQKQVVDKLAGRANALYPTMKDENK